MVDIPRNKPRKNMMLSIEGLWNRLHVKVLIIIIQQQPIRIPILVRMLLVVLLLLILLLLLLLLLILMIRRNKNDVIVIVIVVVVNYVVPVSRKEIKTNDEVVLVSQRKNVIVLVLALIFENRLRLIEIKIKRIVARAARKRRKIEMQQIPQIMIQSQPVQVVVVDEKEIITIVVVVQRNALVLVEDLSRMKKEKRDAKILFPVIRIIIEIKIKNATIVIVIIIIENLR